MIGKIFAAIICCHCFIHSSVIAQKLELSEQLKININDNMDQDLIIALDSLVNQIGRNDVGDNLLWDKEANFTKAVLDDAYFYEHSYLDSVSVLSRRLLNYYPVGEGLFLCQIAYFKTSLGSEISLKMLLSVIAHLEDDSITFSTPLNYLTSAWEEKVVGNVTYFYRGEFNSDRAEKFEQKNVLFASRFKQPTQSFNFFMVDNFQEILRLMGIDFNAKSIGKLRDGYGVVANEYIFSVMNNEDFSHDLFHFYSRKIHNSSIRNWVTEEGLAYSWGNAYYTNEDGEMGEQKELIDVLKQYLNRNNNVDILELFEDNFWIDESGIYSHLAPDFKVGRVISSLICDEVMRVHGMDGINNLISCGYNPNHFDPFFEVTDRLININRSNFNERIILLLK